MNPYEHSIFETDLAELALEVRCCIDRTVPRDSTPSALITGALLMVMLDEMGRLPEGDAARLRQTIIRGILAPARAGFTPPENPN